MLRTNPDKSGPLVLLAIGLLPFVLYGALYPVLYAGHRWQQDEIAFVFGSLDQTPGQWFSKGYSRYFNVYPEWSRPLTNFLRPFSNLVVTASHALFGDQRSLYFLTAYLPLSINGVLVFVILRKVGLAASLALALCVLAMATPAALGIALYQLPFQFDLWASSFALAAFVLLAGRRYLASFCCLLLCILTKETALFAPVAAAAGAWLVFRARLVAVALFLPALVWAGARILAFGDVTTGVYTLQSKASMVLHTLTTTLQWPLGVLPSHEVFAALSSGSASAIALKVVLPLLANGCLWLLVLVACFRTARYLWLRPSGSAPLAPEADERLALRHLAPIWLACAVGWALVAGLETRMGAGIYLFLIVVIGVLLAEPALSRPIRLLSIASSIVLLGASVVAAKSWMSLDQNWNHVEKALIAALQATKGSGPVYVVNAPSTYSAPRFYATAYGGMRPLVFLNQFTGCDSLPLPEVASASEVRLQLPSCANLFFANVVPETFAGAQGSPVARANIGTYSFPDASVRTAKGRVFSGDRLEVDLGRRLRIELATPPSMILAYDGQSGKYVEVFASGGSSR